MDRNDCQDESYWKEWFGELLLILLAGDGQPDGWQQFETELRKFYEADGESSNKTG
jgi:hypothetical protein